MAKDLLRFVVSDNADLSEVVMTFDEFKQWVDNDLVDMRDADLKENPIEYTIVPKYFSAYQINNMKEADI